MSRRFGLEEYKGEKLNNKFKIGFGKDKKFIDECPMSYADWNLVRDAMDCYTYREEGFLPYHYDEDLQQPAGILDQTIFFHQASTMVKSIKNQAEADSMEALKNKK
jgi:hypothetical protein